MGQDYLDIQYLSAFKGIGHNQFAVKLVSFTRYIDWAKQFLIFIKLPYKYGIHIRDVVKQTSIFESRRHCILNITAIKLPSIFVFDKSVLC